MSKAVVEKALAKLRVLELCQLVAGPYCTKLLADLGAEVIKVEEPGSGDEARRKGPFLDDVPHAEKSGLFLWLNAGKLGITLNLEAATGKAILRELVRQSDVLVEDNPPGMMEQMGLGFEALHAINPGLVMTSITPFGQTGPYKGYKAYHLNVYHAAGDGYLVSAGEGYFDRPPLRGGRFVADYEAGVGATIATLAASYWRGLSRQGQHIDVSKQEWCLGLNRLYLDSYPNEGKLVTRQGLQYAVGGILRCRDGYIMLMLLEERHWERLVDLMGSPAWAKDGRFRTQFGRTQHGAEINGLVTEWLMKFNKEELYHRMQAHGIPVGMVTTPGELADSPQMKARQFFTDIDHPQAGRLQYPTAPYRFSRTPLRTDQPAPLLGQHNEEIYCGRLGYVRHGLVKLREAGII